MSISYAKNVGLVKTPPIAKIGNNLYRTVQIGTRVWIAENLKEVISGVTSHVWNGSRYYNKDTTQKNIINNFLMQYGFRYPTISDLQSIGFNGNVSTIRSIIATGDVWANQGTGETALNLLPNKNYVVDIGHELPTTWGDYWLQMHGLDNSWCVGFKFFNGNWESIGDTQPDSYEYVIRAVRDA